MILDGLNIAFVVAICRKIFLVFFRDIKKCLGKKKEPKKALIPLPPTGFTSLFCAKAGWGANGGSAQARCGVCGVFRNCTQCKVLRRSAAALHCVMGRRQIGKGSETPRLQGLCLRKPAADGVFVFGTVRTRCELVTI